MIGLLRFVLAVLVAPFRSKAWLQAGNARFGSRSSSYTERAAEEFG
jgi:hypothetical protein